MHLFNSLFLYPIPIGPRTAPAPTDEELADLFEGMLDKPLKQEGQALDEKAAIEVSAAEYVAGAVLTDAICEMCTSFTYAAFNFC